MAMSSMPAAATGWQRQVRSLFLVAMAVFVVTILIGILNGLDLVEFNHDQILTHVHSGTLGWITLSLVAATAAFLLGVDRRLALGMAVLIPVYVLAFYLAIPALRAVAGVALLVLVLWLFVWVWQVYRARPMLPTLAIALGFSTFTYGAIIGVLRQVENAIGSPIFPTGSDVVGAHASAMVFGYLILVAMGLLEWRILGTTDLPRAGVVQLVALFAGGAVISGTLLFLSGDAIQAAGGLNLLLNLTAAALFTWRVVPRALRGDWGQAVERQFALSAIFVVLAVVFFLYVVFRFISDPAVAADVTLIAGVLVASDHITFIGVITNLVVGVLLAITADRSDRWPWANQVAFLGVNLGLAIFIVGLVTETAAIKQIGAPIMGISLYVTLAALATRLWDSEVQAPAT